MATTAETSVVRILRTLVGKGDLTDVESERKRVLSIILCTIVCIITLPFSISALLRGSLMLGLMELGLFLLLAGFGLYMRKSGYSNLLSYLGGLASGGLFLHLLYTGGANASGPLWFLTFPVFALFILGATQGAIASLLLLGAALGIFVAQVGVEYSWTFRARFLTAYMVILAFTFFFERTRELAQRQLAQRNRELEGKVKELKETDAARQQNETVLEATLEATGDGVLVVSNKGAIIAANDQFAQMWGLSRDAIVGDVRRLVQSVAEQLEEPAAFTSRIESLDDTMYCADTLRFTDGRVFERFAAPLVVDADVKGRVWSFRDTTEQERAEKEREQLQAELQRSQKMEALGTLAGGVAHDLNNVLAGIVSLPELMLMDLPPDSPLREDLVTIRMSGHKAAMIVQDLLTLARRGVPKKEVLSLNQVVRSYLDSPEHNDLLSFHPGVTVNARLDDSLLRICGSPLHLTKALMNLISNAAEAMPDGGKVEISTVNRYVDTPLFGHDSVREGEYVLLMVRDAGVGIAADKVERIFEPFYTDKRMGRSGSGLGMAVVWGAVKDLDGYIDVQSKVGQGSTFTLYFPATREHVSDEQRRQIGEYKGSGQTVLVVDDVGAQRVLAKRMLTALNYSVATVSSGEEAVDYLQEHDVDLLVLDMIMDPGIDGLETYKRILKTHPHQRAIIASGFSETERVKQAQALGAGQYLRKPYLLEEIGLAVKAALEE